MQRAPIALAAAALAVAAAACGSSSSGGGSSTSGASSPADAITSFVQGFENGATTGCNFAAPNQQSECKSVAPSITASGFSVGNTFTDGDQAIVVLLASKFCSGTGSSTTTTVCYSNSDSSKGLPSSDADFASALSALFGDSTSPDAACVQVDGSWYVELAPGGGAASSTGATGATGGATGTTGGTTSTTTAGATGATGTGATGTGATGTTGGSTTTTS
jgi:hypothetical protein